MILGKSCKLIPVMLMHWVLYRRKFQWFKYLSVAIITTGVSLFMFLHPKKDGKGASASSLWGLSLLALNLIMDGSTNSSQDHIFQEYKVTGQQMMFSMNFMSVILHCAYLSLNPFISEFSSAVSFIQAHPAIIQYILLFGLCGAIGQIFIFYTLENYGSVSLVTVTVTRKLGTMVLSVFWFGHRLSFGQWMAVGMVFAGIVLEEYIKKLDKVRKMADKAKSDIPLGEGRKGSV
ncbi:UDP-galactose transporter 1 [Neolecta irregularis DAH-3]|uniref:UDP-galactose transporter homolog 1 n=1 Tax=Neolecta irregularis (strain DAH-3) TaxID=1198029 RepID=A0A1U7LPY4_NEOID|nr:UDP-galactose transporter 1 [Neolecta irregularis DAH-3]|eukprot:OLL24581.1 UDP-galactose transporter 1 [Neolecta irregularis DAH-3]